MSEKLRSESSPSTSVSDVHINQNIDQFPGRTKVENISNEILTAKKVVNDTYQTLQSMKKKIEFDEYDHFAFLMAAKIKRIENTYERESVMNSIQNLVFQALVDRKTATSFSQTSLSHSDVEKYQEVI